MIVLVYDRIKLKTKKLMEKSRTLGTNLAFVCYLLLQETNIHINLICFDHNFDHPHINVVTFIPRKQAKKPQFFPQKHFDLLKKSLICT